MDLISVIVPIYKVEEYLDRCVSSIAGQTYSDLEIILVDDGSPDRCPAMCDEWAKKDSRIRVIHKENGGLSDARNAGMRAATGEYISFIDSDDIVAPEFLECLHRATVTKDVDIVACDYFTFLDDQISISINDKPFKVDVVSAEEAIEDILNNRRFRAIAWNKLYRRVIVENEFFEYGRLHEDEFFTYRMIDKAKRLAYVNAKLYGYRQRAGSIMNSYSIRHLDSLYANLERIDLISKSYPRLLLKDKLIFCIGCANHFCASFAVKGGDGKAIRKKVIELRKMVKYTYREFAECSARDKLYVVLSKSGAMKLFYYLRKMRGSNG